MKCMMRKKCKQPSIKQDPKVGRLVAEGLVFRKGKGQDM
jgi:hypothetical protein